MHRFSGHHLVANQLFQVAFILFLACCPSVQPIHFKENYTKLAFTVVKLYKQPFPDGSWR